MGSGPTVIMASGGLRSLVATAVVASSSERSRLALLHVKDGRPNASVRLAHAKEQAEHFHIRELIELELPHLHSQASVQRGGATAGAGRSGVLGGAGEAGGSGGTGGAVAADGMSAALVRPQLLLVAVAQAVELGASRLVWPAQVNGDYDTIARLTEQVVLLQHLVQLEQPAMPVIDTPLLELTDAQLIQLGGQFDVPWRAAWTCTLRGDVPCRICEACRRRRAGFEAAGMTDAADKPVAART